MSFPSIGAPHRYGQTAGVTVQMEQIEESIRFLLEDRVDYELRTTVVEQLHDCDAMERMGQWVSSLAAGRMVKRWFVQPFVDRDTVLFTGLSRPNDAQLSEFAGVLSRFSALSEIRG